MRRESGFDVMIKKVRNQVLPSIAVGTSCPTFTIIVKANIKRMIITTKCLLQLEEAKKEKKRKEKKKKEKLGSDLIWTNCTYGLNP